VIIIPWEYPTIQEGIDASQNGDTILVMPGIYHEFVRYSGKDILLCSSFGPESTFVSQVIFSGGTDSSAILRGFSLYGTGDNGSSVEIEGGSSGSIEGNRMSMNSTFGMGGGIYSIGNNVIIRENIISNNRALERGGGINISGVGFLISDNIIEGNIAGGDDESWGGGGMYVDGSDFIIKYNLIANNQAGDPPWPPVIGGGGAQIWTGYGGGRTKISNNTFVGNKCLYLTENAGSGLWISSGDTVRIINNIFAYNYQGGVWTDVTPYYILDYNLAWDNDYGDYGGFEPGPNCLFVDPLFVNPWGGNYHLQPNSPCIDAGDPNSLLDPDSTRADIGCYFYDHSTDILETDNPSGPHKFYLKQNYPNPFNGETIISYYLPQDAFVELNIINMRGELVAKPVNSRQSSGNHTLTWPGTRSDGTPVSTGIYFYELKVGPHRDIKAMILLK